MKYKILVLDIDGTLNNSKKEITPKTKEAIADLQKKGVAIVIASGRPTYGIMPVARELGLEKTGGYILSYNGGKIINCKTEEVFYEKILPNGSIRRVAEMADKERCAVLSYDGDCVIATDVENPYVQLEAKINHLPIAPMKSFEEYDDMPVNKCLIVGDGEYLETIEADFVKAFPEMNVFRSEAFFLEFVPQGIDKALSLSVLLEELGLTKEEMVACGDGFNDLSMIEYAGMGVAMKNAKQEVKDVADFITKSNDEDGVAYAIEQLF